eukprot:12471158-Alexandrium_andersonii.AAC.1
MPQVVPRSFSKYVSDFLRPAQAERFLEGAYVDRLKHLGFCAPVHCARAVPRWDPERSVDRCQDHLPFSSGLLGGY